MKKFLATLFAIMLMAVAALAIAEELPYEAEYDPNPDYDEYTVIEYTFEDLGQDIITTISRKADGSEYFLECSFFGDDQLVVLTWDGSAYEVIQDKTGFMKTDSPLMCDQAIEQDIWLPIEK